MPPIFLVGALAEDGLRVRRARYVGHCAREVLVRVLALGVTVYSQRRQLFHSFGLHAQLALRVYLRLYVYRRGLDGTYK